MSHKLFMHVDIFDSLSGYRVEPDAVAGLPLQLDDVVGQPLLHLLGLQVPHVHALHQMREPAMTFFRIGIRGCVNIVTSFRP